MGTWNRRLLEDRGTAHGLSDCMAVASCPQGTPAGPSPELDWSHFYMLAYDAAWALAEPHGTCQRCRGDRKGDQ